MGVPQEVPSNSGRSDMRDTDVRDQVRNIRYGSRKSTYGGSDIYIIYKSGRAYPEYVIEYEDRSTMERLLGIRQAQTQARLGGGLYGARNYGYGYP